MTHWHRPAELPDRAPPEPPVPPAFSLPAATAPALLSEGGGITSRWNVVVSDAEKCGRSWSTLSSSRNLPANNNRMCDTSGGRFVMSVGHLSTTSCFAARTVDVGETSLKLNSRFSALYRKRSVLVAITGAPDAHAAPRDLALCDAVESKAGATHTN
eukprot:CAMPEP_0119412710 /NCGR_PEP_ID=MMETSP1335-20130426/5049_1 /TAXON_ID=259385 /ORGANISM="Chrysoculter rhomboideus, Strain RCC1486" /LENGTH=156 /DNA_ID=CAMNT_0007437461 /DNA_START=334 /DNA_END=801 /DNA_ORIENTATION=+